MTNELDRTFDTVQPLVHMSALMPKQSPHYHNNLIVSMDGRPLSTVDDKRVQWYLDRKLACPISWADKRYRRVIQLTFKHAGSKYCDSATEPVANQCVVCGTQDDLTAHHVTPYRFKRIYPKRDKEHTKEWVVLTCGKHHHEAERIIEQDGLKCPYHVFMRYVHRLTDAICRMAVPFARLYSAWWLWRQGGARGLNARFRELFMRLNPQHLPKGWLK